VVRVRFFGTNVTLAYYNDQFDLRVGDIVFVDGKYVGVPGRVMEVSHHFKIKISDYKHVCGLADTQVHGTFYQAGSHLVTFQRSALPYDQFRSWVLPPKDEESEYYIGYDEEGFSLDDLSAFPVSQAIFQRGVDYYQESRVEYLCLDGERGQAIVRGTSYYEVEFQYHQGDIRDLFCDCPCGANCKHEVAVLLQLKESLELLEKQYAAAFADSSYFAAVVKPVFFRFAVDGNPDVALTLS
jgi:hypothetical protein